jgi:sugar phosphate isomerase/epimerase
MRVTTEAVAATAETPPVGARGFSSAMYGWRQRARDEGRPDDAATVARDAAAAGLDALESDGRMDVYPHLAGAGLRVSAQYLGLTLHDTWAAVQAEERVLPAARRLAEHGGTDLLVNPAAARGDSGPLPKSGEQARRQGEHLSRLAELVAPLGVRVCVHNHATRFELTAADLRSVVEHSAPEVGLCIDTGWAHTSGHDPLAWIRAYPRRVFAVHLRNQRGAVPTEDLLEGDLDVAAIVAALLGSGYRGWLSMELWHPAATAAQRSMVEDVRRSVAYLRRLVAEHQNGGRP